MCITHAFNDQGIFILHTNIYNFSLCLSLCFCLFVYFNFTKSHISMLTKQTAKANKKQGQNKKKTNVDSLSTHQSPLKLAETE